MEMEIVTLTILLNDSFIKFLFLVLAAMNSAGLEMIVTKGKMLSSRDKPMFP